MEFEPVATRGFEPWVQIDLNPFEPVKSAVGSNTYVRCLTGNLTVIHSITARTGKPGFARAVTHVMATAQFMTLLTRIQGSEMNPRNRARKRPATQRGSKHMHLWPELEYMPPLDHWPNRPGPYRPEDSQVLQYLADGFGMSPADAENLFGSARKKGVLRYDPASGLWAGRKGGPT